MTRMTMSEAIISAIDDRMAADPSVYLLGQDVGVFGGPMQSSKGLWERYGSTGRIIDAPISEAAMIGTGIGAALAGAKPIIDLMFAEFLMLGATPLGFDGASMAFRSGGHVSVPLVLRAKYGVGPHRGHAESAIGALMGFPGLKIAVPTTPQDGYSLMAAAIDDPNPVVFLEHMSMLHGPRGEVDRSVTAALGSAQVAREGTDVTVVTYGLMVPRALRAARTMQAEGIDTQVIDLRTVAPLDMSTVASSVARTSCVVLVEESWPVAGPMAQICLELAQLLGDAHRYRIRVLTPPHTPIPYGLELEKTFVPSVQDIEQAIRDISSNLLPLPEESASIAATSGRSAQ